MSFSFMCDIGGPVGEIFEMCTAAEEIKELEWRIRDFLSLNKNIGYESPSFTFHRSSWNLTLNPNFQGNLRLLLKSNDTGKSYYVMGYCCIKRIDGANFAKSCFKMDFGYGKEMYEFNKFYNNEKLLCQKSELLDSFGSLTIKCFMMCVPDDQNMKLSGQYTLSKSMEVLFNNQQFCDTTLLVDGIEFKAHKAILAARSPVFAAAFPHDMVEKETGVITVDDCDPSSFQDFLEYIYSGRLENLSFRNAYHLYQTADKYNVDELKFFCMNYMGINMKLENFFDVLALAEKHEDAKLLDAIQYFFNGNIGEIQETPQWENIIRTNFSVVNRLLKRLGSAYKDLMKDTYLKQK